MEKSASEKTKYNPCDYELICKFTWNSYRTENDKISVQSSFLKFIKRKRYTKYNLKLWIKAELTV